MSLLNESWPPKDDDGVSLTNAAHPRPWYWWATWLWYRLFPPRLNEVSLERLLIEIRRQADADGKKIQIKPTRVIYRPADRE
jgi:hypothetical protein